MQQGLVVEQSIYNDLLAHPGKVDRSRLVVDVHQEETTSRLQVTYPDPQYHSHQYPNT
jgi:hypothetical protein